MRSCSPRVSTHILYHGRYSLFPYFNRIFSYVVLAVLALLPYMCRAGVTGFTSSFPGLSDSWMDLGLLLGSGSLFFFFSSLRRHELGRALIHTSAQNKFTLRRPLYHAGLDSRYLQTLILFGLLLLKMIYHSISS
jgi:hypothetical protein